MKFIGITGGVGAGKSAILEYLSKKENTKVMLADEIAHILMEPGTSCYMELAKAFRDDNIFLEDGFDKNRLASIIFADAAKRERLNGIVHPAVKDYVRKEYEREFDAKRLDLLVLEAALLIEEHYDEICDELWYIYTEEEIRRARLKASRGYSDEKINNIFASQMKEAEFRRHCKFVIDNNGDIDSTIAQIDKAIEGITK